MTSDKNLDGYLANFRQALRTAHDPERAEFEKRYEKRREV